MSPVSHTVPLTVLWRGRLSGCNYDCNYCPFAKRTDSRQTLAKDHAALTRFVDWILARRVESSVLFTPWGEALVRRYYREAIVQLSHGVHIRKVAIQTNLSAPLNWLVECDLSRVGIWATWHPDQVSLDRFLKKIVRLQALGVAYSVGVVAVREHLPQIERLRVQLPSDAYMWINAEESIQGCYTPAEIERLSTLDPLFELNNRAYASQGRACATGHRVISVNDDGTAWRCHFVKTPLGSIYEPDFEARLHPSPCPQQNCHCHIGYSHLDDLGLADIFGQGFLERRACRPQREDALKAIERFRRKADRA
ncbi:MAG: STM4011 family radical SAM protein [Parahaliea sp.]